MKRKEKFSSEADSLFPLKMSSRHAFARDRFLENSRNYQTVQTNFHLINLGVGRTGKLGFRYCSSVGDTSLWSKRGKVLWSSGYSNER